MKYVGEAVNMLQSSRKVVAFGIAPWGCVMNKRELTAPEVFCLYEVLRTQVVNRCSEFHAGDTKFLPYCANEGFFSDGERISVTLCNSDNLL